jgi:dolichyl-phosphooligosaccharide-protein glycotransferase
MSKRRKRKLQEKNQILKQSKSKKEEIDEDEQILNVNYDSIVKFFKKYGVFFLVLIPIFLAIFFRVHAAYLPITDEWAESTVINYYRNQITQQISQQNPNLPEATRNTLIEQELAKQLTTNKDMIAQQIEQTSQDFKSRMQDEDGQTYLLAIDPWLWYGMAENYIEYGHMGDKLIDGKSYYTLRGGRENQRTTFNYFVYTQALVYKFINMFGSYSMLTAAFYHPVIVMVLATIFIFFLIRKMVNIPAALLGASIFAVHAAMLGRTSGGFSDTDASIILGEVAVIYLFSLALDAKKNINKYLFAGVAGFALAFYAMVHVSWWHTLYMILGALGIFLVSKIIITKNLFKKFEVERITKKTIQAVTDYKHYIFIFLIMLGFTIFFGVILHQSAHPEPTMLDSIKTIAKAPVIQLWNFVNLKEVGITNVWPRVYTTVAELNTSSVTQAINQIGGKFLFVLSIIGIISILFKRDKNYYNIFYAMLALFWMLGAIYAAQHSLRFGILMVPPFAIGIGALIGIMYERLAGIMQKEFGLHKALTKISVVIVAILIISPIISDARMISKNQIPSMNDAWYKNLKAINADSEDAIITSWWDFGHWFVQVADRRVTFDGGDQGERIHWVGKSLLTKDENMSVGLLRMLNCGQEKPPHIIAEYLDNDTVKAVQILNEIMVVDKDEAIEILKNYQFTDDQIDNIITHTHCEDLFDQYYITSDDMIGKAGVWGHFGSWNFTKASMYNKVNKLKQQKGVELLKTEFGMDDAQATKIYAEIKTTKGDMWIAGWPGYMPWANNRYLASCNLEDALIKCQNGVEINTQTLEATLTTNSGRVKPDSLVYVDDESVKELKYEGDTAGISIALIPEENGYSVLFMDPLQAGSMFTILYFYQGHGLKCFELFKSDYSFTGNVIHTWKVDWECNVENNLFQTPEEETVSAKHILITTENRTQEEALEIITLIQEEINETNFEDLAREYSECPSASQGGDLGEFGKGAMVKEFEDSAFNLEINEVSEPVLTEFGYHLIKVYNKTDN